MVNCFPIFEMQRIENLCGGVAEHAGHAALLGAETGSAMPSNLDLTGALYRIPGPNKLHSLQ